MSATLEARAKTEYMDYLCLIAVGADTWGVSSFMKLVKLFVESGAAGIHMENQLCGVKKVSLILPFVLLQRSAVAIHETYHYILSSSVSRKDPSLDFNTHISLGGLPLSDYSMLSILLLIARTDSESAKFISSNVDAADYPFILGMTHAGPEVMPLPGIFANAEANGKIERDIDHLEAEG